MKIETLMPGHYYHIYNRGNNGIDVFFEKDNYVHFLRLYEKYITPIADAYAWCLMRNHFHFLVYLKEADEINVTEFSYSTNTKPKTATASNQFSHLFNPYTQTINKRQKRTGSLLEKPFERKRVSSEEYFKTLILYIHKNPVNHGVVENIMQYNWSSYNTILSVKPTKLKRREVIEYFDTLDNFIACHNKELDIEDFF